MIHDLMTEALHALAVCAQICKDLATEFYKPAEGVRALHNKLWVHLQQRLERDWIYGKLHNGSKVMLCKKRTPAQLYHLEYSHAATAAEDGEAEKSV